MYKRSHVLCHLFKKVLIFCLCVLLLFGAVSAGSAEGNISSDIVNAWLLQQTSKLKDPWQKAILESGVRDLSVDGNKVTFSMRSYDPKIKSLGAYASASDPTAWLMSALQNASAYDLELSLDLEGGTVSSKSLKTLVTVIRKAAATAKKDFGGKDMTAALKDYLFPVPASGKVKTASDLSSPGTRFAAWYADHGDLLNHAPVEVAVAAFYLQKSQALSVKNGPHALELSCVGASLSDLTDDAVREIQDAQAYLPVSARTAVTDPEAMLKQALLTKVIPAVKKARQKTVLTLDVDNLAAGELPAAYRQYFSSFSWDDTVYSLTSALNRLPDAAAQPLPKAGVLSGQNRGTRVIFKISDDSNPTYIIMRDSLTDRIAVTALAMPKKKTTVHVPQGHYYIAWCSGPYWYGEQELFSSLGSYSKSDQVEILGKRYYHTFTLVTSRDGNIPVTGANPADFR